MTDPTHALSFGVAAAEYDRFRPRCPEVAPRWALAGRETVELPYRPLVFRARRR
ncbi:hypothetical protein ACPFP2_28205 [Micromonospora citrea]|uniref:hypothetical protein n=1 Tax=Micromonospora citrea TaxID=47855 RepID=UPI003C4B0A21